MEIRLLRSFLAIAEEGNLTRAADVLHITQPALSRQLNQLETDLGTALFVRGKRAMVLTDDGIILRRRAEEILQLVDLTESELGRGEEVVGRISIGMGEMFSCGIVLDAIQKFTAINPNVTFDILSGVADQVTERLDRGLLDFGLLLEPVDKEKYSFVRLHQKERWVAVMAIDDPLAQSESVRPKDLADRTLMLPSRPNVRNELAQWFGRLSRKLDVRYTVNLGGIRAGMIARHMGILLGVEGSASYWDPSRFVSIPLEPAIESESALAWKREVAHDSATSAFVSFIEENL